MVWSELSGNSSPAVSNVSRDVMKYPVSWADAYEIAAVITSEIDQSEQRCKESSQ